MFTLYYQAPPNTLINLIKRSPQNHLEQVFLGKSTGLQEWKWIATDFWTGFSEIKAAILAKFLLLLVDISLLLSVLAFFPSYLQDNKAP